MIWWWGIRSREEQDMRRRERGECLCSRKGAVSFSLHATSWDSISDFVTEVPENHGNQILCLKGSNSRQFWVLTIQINCNFKSIAASAGEIFFFSDPTKNPCYLPPLCFSPATLSLLSALFSLLLSFSPLFGLWVINPPCCRHSISPTSLLSSSRSSVCLFFQGSLMVFCFTASEWEIRPAVFIGCG